MILFQNTNDYLYDPSLTRWNLLTRICVSKLDHYWFGKWLVALRIGLIMTTVIVLFVIAVVVVCWFPPFTETVTIPVVKWKNYDIIMFPAIFFIWHLPLYLYDWSPTQIHLPSVIQCGVAPGSHCWNTCLRRVGSLRFIYGSGTRRFHLRMSGPQMSSGVSPIVRMPQWWSRRWPPWDNPRRHKVVLCILSLRVHDVPLRVAPMPAVRYDLNGGLPTCIRFIIYLEHMVIVYWRFF